ncbi:MAG TPA: OmpA family protein [Steroidobacteraceae bacterium]|jgi:outer membrane protein OmpA-like peptidoglycan-associated protein|nr:OmpA family protein [Steroidobacteraceae bacterium]
MNSVISRAVGTVGLLGLSAVALAGEPAAATPPATPHEPIGFVAGGVIGGFAAGPIGAVVGAGLGTWLGNRVHRASDAGKAEAKVAALESDNTALTAEKGDLLGQKNALADANRTLTAQVDEMTRKIEAAQATKPESGASLDGVEGDVMFRTGSAEIEPQTAHQIEALAQAVSKSPDLKVRVDGYADPRGSVETNLKLSQDRANAVRDLLLAAGIQESSLDVNAYGKSQSTAADVDGYAFERRVRLTLSAPGPQTVAQVSDDQPAGKQ